MDAEALLTHDAFVRGLARGLVLGFEDAEDVAQDAWVATLENPPRPGPGIRGWLATVTRNVVRQGRRSRLRRIAREASVARPEAVPSNETIREREATRRRVVEAVLELDEPYREAVVLRYLEGQPPRRIAEQLDVPVETVKTRLKRALSELRKDLDRETAGGRKAWTAALLPLTGLKLPAAVGIPLKAVVAMAVVLLVGAFWAIPRVLDVPEPDEASRTASRGDLADADDDMRSEPDSGTAEDRGGTGTTSSPVPPPGGILVLGPDGRPVTARVMTTPGPVADMNVALVLGEAGDDGRLRSGDLRRVPRAHIWARNGRLGVAGPVDWNPQGVILRLGDGLAIEGIVRTPNGEPIPGVEVSGWWTDVLGRFRIPHCFPGTPYELTVEPVGVKRKRMPAVTLPTAPVEFVLDLPEGPAILVRVRMPEMDRSLAGILLAEVDGKDARIRIAGRDDTYVRIDARRIAGKRVRLSARFAGLAAGPVEVTASEKPGIVRVDLDTRPGPTPTHGLVLDAEGRPAAGVEIYVEGKPGFEYGPPDLTTGEDGRFPVSLGWIGRHLQARIEGRATSDWFAFGKDVDDVTLRLRAGAAVAGRVLDRESGTPVPHATVELKLGREGAAYWRIDADAEGRYRFDGIPPGTFVLPWVPSSPRAAAVIDARKMLDEDTADLLEHGIARTLVKSDDVFERDLRCVRLPGRAYVFRLAFPDGVVTPRLVEVTHRMHTRTRMGRSERREPIDPADPRVVLRLSEGRHDLGFRAGLTEGFAREIQVVGDGPDEEVEVPLAPRPRVVVQVVDEAGRPLEQRDVVVDLSVRTTYVRTDSKVPTDERGRADVTDVLPTIRADEMREAKLLVSLRGEGVFTGDHNRPALTLDGATFIDRLVASDGRPVVLEVTAQTHVEFEVPVLLAAKRPKRPVPGVRALLDPPDCFTAAEVVSDARGMLRIGIRKRDRMRDAVIRAQAPWLGEIEVDDAMDHDPDDPDVRSCLVVSRARKVRVLVLDEFGRPLAGKVVEVEGSGPRGSQGGSFDRDESTTDDDGCLTVVLPEEKAGVSVRLQGRSNGHAVFLPGEREKAVRLETLRRLRVEVTAPGYRGDLIYLRVSVPCRRDGDIERANSTWTAEYDVAARAGEVRAMSSDPFWEGRAEFGADDDTVRVRLVPKPLHPVILRIVDRENRSVGGTAVRLGPPFDGWKRVATTDSEGRVRFELPAGKYSGLRVEVEGCRRLQPWSVAFELPDTASIIIRADRGGLQSAYLELKRTPTKEDRALVKVTFHPADGSASVQGSPAMSFGEQIAVTVPVNDRPGRIEITFRGHTFSFDYPGKPIPPPSFFVR